MKKTVRWVDAVQKFTRFFIKREEKPREFLFMCTGGPAHAVLFAAQLERFRLAVGTDKTPVSVLLREDAKSPTFLFEDRATVYTIDLDKFGNNSNYRANKLTEAFESNFKGVISLDYERQPELEEAYIIACKCPAMAMKPAMGTPYDAELLANEELFTGQFDTGAAGIPVVDRWINFADWLSSTLNSTVDILLDKALLPEPVAYDAPTLLIQPFAVDAAAQQGSDFYLPIIDGLADGWQVKVIGSKDLVQQNPDLKGLIEHARVELVDTYLEAALPMMLGAKALIAVDSAPLHVAIAAGVTTIDATHEASRQVVTGYSTYENTDHLHVINDRKQASDILGKIK